MCNSVITVGAVACLVCEKDITEAIHENFYRDPVQTYKQYTCPNCQTLLDVEVIPVPYFQLSMPIGRLASTRPTPLALDGATVCRQVNHFYVDGVCAECGSVEPPRQ